MTEMNISIIFVHRTSSPLQLNLILFLYGEYHLLKLVFFLFLIHHLQKHK